MGEANCTNGLGQIAFERLDLDSARKRYEEALPLYQRVGDWLGKAGCIQGLGDIALKVGNLRQAHELHLSALAIYEKIPAPISIGRARCELARLASDKGARRAHVAAARAAWRSIERDDLIEQLDAEFGAA